MNGEKLDELLLSVQRQTHGLNPQNAAKVDARPNALARAAGPILPTITVENRGKAPLGREVGKIAKARHGVLQERGDDREIFAVAGGETKRFLFGHGIAPTGQSS